MSKALIYPGTSLVRRPAIGARRIVQLDPIYVVAI